MMNKIKDIAYRLFYALPFGMKTANEEIMASNSSNGDGQEIQKEVSDERVAKHLLKGEVTQSVKELRYRTYKVDDEAKKYEYVGNGTVLKKEENKRTNHIKFSQECKLVTSDVLEELKRIGSYGVENYTLQIAYNNPLVIFKLEQFATQIDVDINKETNEIFTTLHFSNIPDGYNKKSAPFINELKKLITIYENTKLFSDRKIVESVYGHNELASSMITLNFTTYKATNDEPDLIVYGFYKPFLIKCEESNAEIRLTFNWEGYTTNNLRSKFFDESMEKKYQNKERKNVSVDITGGVTRVAKCEICGDEMNVYDADVTKYTYGKCICKKCLPEYLLGRNK